MTQGEPWMPEQLRRLSPVSPLPWAAGGCGALSMWVGLLGLGGGATGSMACGGPGGHPQPLWWPPWEVGTRRRLPRVPDGASLCTPWALRAAGFG